MTGEALDPKGFPNVRRTQRKPIRRREQPRDAREHTELVLDQDAEDVVLTAHLTGSHLYGRLRFVIPLIRAFIRCVFISLALPGGRARGRQRRVPVPVDAGPGSVASLA